MNSFQGYELKSCSFESCSSKLSRFQNAKPQMFRVWRQKSQTFGVRHTVKFYWFRVSGQGFLDGGLGKIRGVFLMISSDGSY